MRTRYASDYSSDSKFSECLHLLQSIAKWVMMMKGLVTKRSDRKIELTPNITRSITLATSEVYKTIAKILWDRTLWSGNIWNDQKLDDTKVIIGMGSHESVISLHASEMTEIDEDTGMGKSMVDFQIGSQLLNLSGSAIIPAWGKICKWQEQPI